MAERLIEMHYTIDDGADVRHMWRHFVGLVLLEMKQRGWTGGRILDAGWKDGVISIQVGPGHDKIDVDALASFIKAKPKKGKGA